MKKALLYWFSFLAILIALTSCRAKLPEKVIVEKTKEVTITEKVRDTVLVTEKDSSYYKAYIECINNKPVIKDATATPGKILKAPNVNLTNNQLTVDCKQEAEKIFFQWKEKYIKEHHKEQVPVIVPAEFTDWQIIKMKLGEIFLWLLLIPIVYIIYKLIKR